MTVRIVFSFTSTGLNRFTGSLSRQKCWKDSPSGTSNAFNSWGPTLTDFLNPVMELITTVAKSLYTMYLFSPFFRGSSCILCTASRRFSRPAEIFLLSLKLMASSHISFSFICPIIHASGYLHARSLGVSSLMDAP